MANCHDIFLAFNEKKVKLTDAKRKILIEKRTVLEKKILKGLKEDHSEYTFEFRGQGSFAMDTIINPSSVEEKYDVDYGLFLVSEDPVPESPKPTTLHLWVYGIVDDHTGSVQNKDTCIRITYQSNNEDAPSYHVDIPIYWQQKENTPFLAHSKEGWIESDPQAFSDWFNKEADADEQLRRVTRYLKWWSRGLDKKSPKGLAISIWAANSFVSCPDRDDESIQKTAEKIHDTLDGNFQCLRPTTPVNEDITKNYMNKGYFVDELKKLYSIGQNALDNEEVEKAANLWEKVFGDAFPSQLASKIEEAKAVNKAMKNQQLFTSASGKVEMTPTQSSNKIPPTRFWGYDKAQEI